MDESGDSVFVKAPSSLLVPLKVAKKTLCGAGPTNMHPRIAKSLKLPLLGPMYTEFVQIMDEIQTGIQFVFQTKNSFSFAVTGTGHAGMECCMANLVEPGDSVCVVTSGVFGTRCSGMVNRLGGIPHTISCDALGTGVSLGRVEEGLKQYAPVVLYVAQGESSTGVLEDIESIGALCRQYKCLAVVDTVASLGGVPFKMDQWGIDCVFTASQKVLGAPPGTALVSFSDAAVNKYKQRKTLVCSYLLDLGNNAKYWNIEGFGPREAHYTGAIFSFYALREALGVVCEQGLLETQNRHQDAAYYLHSKLESELKLQLFVKDPKWRLPTVTTVCYPKSVDGAGLTKYLMQKFNLEISGGLGPTVGQVWRVGLMGPNASRETVDFIIDCMQKALKSLNNSHI